tara:strand:+ start:47 stop:403 length:357 start_codon:yes stop_codon:yes gene_type:complete
VKNTFLEDILMKITKAHLEKLILQEFHDVTTPPGFQNNLSNIIYRTGPFTNLVTVASDTLERLTNVIRDSEDLEDMDLEGLKNNELQKLMDKIGYLESVIDAKLEGTALRHNSTEGYE